MQYLVSVERCICSVVDILLVYSMEYVRSLFKWGSKKPANTRKNTSRKNSLEKSATRLNNNTNENKVRTLLKKNWPYYYGGSTGFGPHVKKYRNVSGGHGVPMTITYAPPRESHGRILTNVKNLTEGTYLFIIEATRDGEFKPKFLRTEGRIEVSARHSYLANLSSISRKLVAAAGEIQVLSSGRIRFNLESGTFMMPMKAWFRQLHPGENSNALFEKMYPGFVKGVLGVPGATYTKNVLINNTHLPIKEILTRAKNTPGITVKYAVKRRRGLPENISYENWVNAMKERRTRSKGPVNTRLRLR